MTLKRALVQCYQYIVVYSFVTPKKPFQSECAQGLDYFLLCSVLFGSYFIFKYNTHLNIFRQMYGQSCHIPCLPLPVLQGLDEVIKSSDAVNESSDEAKESNSGNYEISEIRD